MASSSKRTVYYCPLHGILGKRGGMISGAKELRKNFVMTKPKTEMGCRV